MNCTKLILFSSVAALALCAVPTTHAQGRSRGGYGGGRSFGSGSRSYTTASAPRSFNGHGYRSAAVANRTALNSRAYRGGHWNGHGGHGHYHHGRYHGYYPYAYYPFGWGFGYPYWGASYYYDSAYAYDGYSGNSGGNSVVTDVQHELARAGYYHGAIDGIIGDGTRRAIRAYESAHGLHVDGRIDSDLLSRMGLS